MAISQREVESKLEVSVDAVLPVLDEVADVARVDVESDDTLEATYFDTREYVLAASGITLRRRAGGDDAGWHLKVPVGSDGRDEVRLPLGRAVKTVPKPLRGAVQVFTRGAELGPIAQVDSRRTVYRLHDSEDQVLAEVADDTVTARGLSPLDTGVEIAWREWEVELVGGKRRHLNAVAQVLTETGAEPAVNRSKLARVLGDRIPDSHVTPDAAPSDRESMGLDSSAATVVHARLREQVNELRRQDPLVRMDVPDSVHKMRVAIRRLRSALKTFEPILQPDESQRLRAELKWIAGVLGPARDAEVMQQRLHDLVAEQPAELVIGPVTRRIDNDLGGLYRASRDASVEAMQSERYFALIDALDTLVAEPPWTLRASQAARDVLSDRVTWEYQRMRRRVAHAEKAVDPATRNERLHEVRIAAKRTRYAAETVAPVYGKRAERLVKAAKKVQSVLGEQHDGVVAQPLLHRLGTDAHRAGENAFTYGRLHSCEQARTSELEAKYQRAWAKASRKKVRRWLS